VRYANGDVTSYVMIAFECRIAGGTLTPDGEESLDLRFVAADELESMSLAPWARRILPRLVAQRGRAWIEPATWVPPQR
jgi:hypothetical protein